jgi:hypothetical protein
MSRIASLAVTASALLLLALTGCQQQSAPAAAATATASDPASISALSVEPATMATCGTGVVATVRWNANAVHASTNATQIWIGADTTNQKLFSEGGAQGETQTGPWTEPGTHFVLKNKDDGKVLADTTVGGPKCP